MSMRFWTGVIRLGDVVHTTTGWRIVIKRFVGICVTMASTLLNAGVSDAFYNGRNYLRRKRLVERGKE